MLMAIHKEGSDPANHLIMSGVSTSYSSYSVHLYRDTDFSMSQSITNGSSFVHTAVNIEKLIIKLVENWL